MIHRSFNVPAVKWGARGRSRWGRKKLKSCLSSTYRLCMWFPTDKNVAFREIRSYPRQNVFTNPHDWGQIAGEGRRCRPGENSTYLLEPFRQNTNSSSKESPTVTKIRGAHRRIKCIEGIGVYKHGEATLVIGNNPVDSSPLIVDVVSVATC